MSSNYPDNIQKSNKTFFYDFFSNPNNPEELFSLLYLLHKSEKDEIYKAKYNETKEIFCIKKISLDNIFIDKNTSKNFYYQMKEETSLMKSLTNNENIIQYYGSFFSFETKNIFLIFEYLKARSVLDLGKIIDRNYTEEEIAIIINDILNGLIYIHQLNIANRNIKINNILLTEDGRAKIGNFEKAKQILNFSKDNKIINVSSDFFVNDKNIEDNNDPKYDIFLIGISCLEMFIGIKNNKFDKDKFIEEIKLNKLIPGNLNKLLETELSKNPSEKISDEFQNFIIKCLDPYSYKRPTAFELINHPFIKNNVNEINKNNFSNLVKNNVEEIENFKEFFYNKSYKHNVVENSLKLSYKNNNNNDSFDNKLNEDKLAEFRIEQMKKNEIIEDEQNNSKDLYSDLDNNSFVLNIKETKENEKGNKKENNLDNILIKENNDLNIGIDLKAKWDHIKNFQNKLIMSPKFSENNLNYNYGSHLLNFQSEDEELNNILSLKNTNSALNFNYNLKSGIAISHSKCDIIKLTPNISPKSSKKNLNNSSVISSKISISQKNKENKKLKNSLKYTVDIENKNSTRDGSLKSKNNIKEIILEKRNSCTPFKIKKIKFEDNNESNTDRFVDDILYKYLGDLYINKTKTEIIKRQKSNVIKVNKMFKEKLKRFLNLVMNP